MDSFASHPCSAPGLIHLLTTMQMKQRYIIAAHLAKGALANNSEQQKIRWPDFGIGQVAGLSCYLP